MQRPAPYKPLPPQKWGFLATNEFWAVASLTPIALLFWAAVPLFFALVEYLGLAWWQSALAFWVFFEVWGGLVERWCRRSLAARRPRALPAAAHESAEQVAERELAVPAGPPAVPTTEDWDEFYRRVFGRLSGAATVASDAAFFLLFFYPGWVSKLVAILLMIAAFFVVRTCTRRWKAASARSESHSGDNGDGRERERARLQQERRPLMMRRKSLLP